MAPEAFYPRFLLAKTSFASFGLSIHAQVLSSVCSQNSWISTSDSNFALAQNCNLY